MCSSTLFVNCEQVAKDTVEKILYRTPFRSGRMSVICARLGSKGKVGVQRGRKTAGCPSFLPPPWARHIPAVRRRRIPPLRFREKLPARQGRTRLRQFACPAQPMQKRSRPSGANPPAAVRVPRSADAEKEPPVRDEPACGSSCAPVSRCSKRSRPSGSNPPAAVRVPRSPCAEKRKAPQNCFHGAQSMHFYSNRSSVSTSLRAGACGSCAG